jgi:hypothetical protein
MHGVFTLSFLQVPSQHTRQKGKPSLQGLPTQHVHDAKNSEYRRSPLPTRAFGLQPCLGICRTCKLRMEGGAQQGAGYPRAFFIWRRSSLNWWPKSLMALKSMRSTVFGAGRGTLTYVGTRSAGTSGKVPARKG